MQTYRTNLLVARMLLYYRQNPLNKLILYLWWAIVTDKTMIATVNDNFSNIKSYVLPVAMFWSRWYYPQDRSRSVELATHGNESDWTTENRFFNLHKTDSKVSWLAIPQKEARTHSEGR